MIASLNNPSAHTKPLILTNLTSAKHEPIVTSSPNPICKPSTSSQQLQLINLNNIAKANCSPIKTINLMSHKPAKSNLLTTVDKIDEDQEENFLSKISESEPGSSNMLDDSLTSLQWLQSLNIMKNTTMVASSCSLSPNSQTSDKFSPSLDCDLDSATIPAASVPKSVDCGKNFHMSYPPLSPPLSVQCSASPQSTCSSNASTKRRSKKTDTNKTVQQLQHQLSAPAILQPSKSQSIMTNSNSAGSVFRSSFLKDRDEYRTNSDVKPPYSYSQLIILSMKESKQSKMTLQMIYDWIIGNFSYFKKKDANWQVTFKNSIRHNLSLNKCFRKIARQKDEPGKGGFWTLDPEFERQLDESNSLGVINTKSYKRKRKNCDDQEDKKKAKPDLVQYNEMENCDFVRSDANLSQVNKAQHNYNYGTNVTTGYMDPQMNHVQHQHQQQSVNSTHFDFSDTFGNSFQSNGMSYDEPNLFNFEANFPTLELDQFTDSSCTSNSSPEDLVSGLLKKNMVSSHDNELSDLFDIASQFNLDENFNATSLINPSNEKKTIDLTVQGTGIRQPKWWTDNLLDLEAGLINVQPHIIQDDECDSAMFISSHGSLDFGLNVDDLEFLSVDPSKDNSSNQQGPQQARKRIYTHQNKLNPAIQKTTRTKPNFS